MNNQKLPSDSQSQPSDVQSRPFGFVTLTYLPDVFAGKSFTGDEPSTPTDKPIVNQYANCWAPARPQKVK